LLIATLKNAVVPAFSKNRRRFVFAPAVHVYEVTDMDYDEDDNLMTIQVRKKKGS